MYYYYIELIRNVIFIQGGHEKGSKHNFGEHKDHYGKSGKHEKGKHYKESKGHKDADGHDEHHAHDEKYGKKKGGDSKKKWHYSKGDGGGKKHGKKHGKSGHLTDDSEHHANEPIVEKKVQPNIDKAELRVAIKEDYTPEPEKIEESNSGVNVNEEEVALQEELEDYKQQEGPEELLPENPQIN